MSWVPHYGVDTCLERLEETYEGAGMKNALTHLGLQFWAPSTNGNIVRVGKPQETGEAQIARFREWGQKNDVRILLCIYNGVKSWDWSLAREGFVEHPDELIDALLQEVRRMKLDGVDIDLEGTGSSFAEDKGSFVQFIAKLSDRLHAEGLHLTVDTFSYHWNAPNQTWWEDLLPYVDGLTTMGYEQTGAESESWRGYGFQKNAAQPHSDKLMIGFPTHMADWQDQSLNEHLAWIEQDGQVGIALWDAQLRSSAWRTPEVWNLLKSLKKN